MMVSHEIAHGKATVTIFPGDPMSDAELARNLAYPFVAEGKRWELLERLEDTDGTVVLRLQQVEGGPPPLDHVRWLEEKGIPRKGRGRQHRLTGAQAQERAARIQALEPEWDAEVKRRLAPLQAQAAGWLRRDG